MTTRPTIVPAGYDRSVRVIEEMRTFTPSASAFGTSHSTSQCPTGCWWRHVPTPADGRSPLGSIAQESS